jgi:hypothetical protein
MEEYRLCPEELIAKAFRVIQSSRRAFKPYGKRDWILAMRKIHREGGAFLPELFNVVTVHYTNQAV